MIVGHTKFSPDRFFGMFKKLFCRSSVSTLTEIATVADRSTNSSQIVPQLIQASDGTLLVTFYQWTAFLGRSIPNIPSYHEKYNTVTCTCGDKENENTGNNGNRHKNNRGSESVVQNQIIFM